MIKSANDCSQDEELDNEEAFIFKKESSNTQRGELRVKVDGKSSDQRPNTPWSKLSATEQRRRRKINDRFQMLLKFHKKNCFHWFIHLARKLNSDGKIDTVPTLHNLNEDKLSGFEEKGKANNIGHLPGWKGRHGTQWNETEIIFFINSLAYSNYEEATMSTIDKDGWLHTGDVV
ncbi:hypothetical protein K1719_024465 [Acacia pycnantha]|nr:hypothetical protein K1719_024465 [Acacia pycnantha]